MTDPRMPPEPRVPVDPPPGRGSQNTLFFIVGGLVVLVGIIAFVMFGRDDGDTTPGTTGTTIEEPATNTDTDTTTDTDTDTAQ
jgi:hypothetical protein